MPVRLAFGTAGIRAPLGDGDDQLNLRTMRAVAYAVLSHVADLHPDNTRRGICVAYDGRTQSRAFAQEACEVALALGFMVRAFETPEPTPLLAFCTRRHGSAAGLMITASHNPPSDNGVKVYLEGGAQIRAPHDGAIAKRLARIDSADAIPKLSPADAPGRYRPLRQEDKLAYVDAVRKLAPYRPSRADAQLPRIAHTALCGVGGPLARLLLKESGAVEVVYVDTQESPRADFGGLSYPNPESDGALLALRQLAEAEQAAIGFAHDPDADRLAVLARDRSGTLQTLSGDDVGALLGYYLLEHEERPAQALMVSTFVSGGCLEALCLARGARFARTHTGFKWIAGRAHELSAAHGLRFVLGYEEAIGYAFGALGDDKDGLAAMYVLCALARTLQSRALCFTDLLDQLANEFGVYRSQQVTVPVAAAGGARALFERVRAMSPDQLLGPGARQVDTGQAPDAPPLLVLEQEPSIRLCVRPSGTEPKLKLYLHGHAPVTSSARLSATRDEVDQHLSSLAARLRTLLV